MNLTKFTNDHASISPFKTNLSKAVAAWKTGKWHHQVEKFIWCQINLQNLELENFSWKTPLPTCVGKPCFLLALHP